MSGCSLPAQRLQGAGDRLPSTTPKPRVLRSLPLRPPHDEEVAKERDTAPQGDIVNSNGS